MDLEGFGRTFTWFDFQICVDGLRVQGFWILCLHYSRVGGLRCWGHWVL